MAYWNLSFLPLECVFCKRIKEKKKKRNETNVQMLKQSDSLVMSLDIVVFETYNIFHILIALKLLNMSLMQQLNIIAIRFYVDRENSSESTSTLQDTSQEPTSKPVSFVIERKMGCSSKSCV